MSSRLVCDICQKSHNNNCLFNLPDNMTIQEFLQKVWKYERDLELVIQWNTNPPANLRILENPDYETVTL